MRYGAEHKSTTRAKVVEAASRSLRRRGPEGLAVAEVMAEAGLTHGGFYAHFPSKDALIAEAVQAAFEDSRVQFLKLGEGRTGREQLNTFVDQYVSAAHRDRPERGCAITALASDMPRQAEAARRAYDAGVARLIARLARLLAGGTALERRARAGSLLAEMAGAVTLARAIRDPVFSDSLLAETRAAVKQRMGLIDTPLEQSRTDD